MKTLRRLPLADLVQKRLQFDHALACLLALLPVAVPRAIPMALLAIAVAVTVRSATRAIFAGLTPQSISTSATRISDFAQNSSTLISAGLAF